MNLEINNRPHNAKDKRFFKDLFSPTNENGVDPENDDPNSQIASPNSQMANAKV